MAEATEDQAFRQWCLLELMGHRRMAGLITEATIGGAALTRIDVYLPEGAAPVLTQFYAPGAVYAITPMTEELARRFAQRNTPEPVSRYDLPQLAPPRVTEVEHPDSDRDDEDDDEVDPTYDQPTYR